MENKQVKNRIFKGVELTGNFSSGTLEWLKWYESLSETHRMMISYEPIELATARRGALNFKDNPILIAPPSVDTYDENGRPKYCKDNWEGTLDYANCYAFAMNVQTQEKKINLAPGMTRGDFIDYSQYANIEELARVMIM